MHRGPSPLLGARAQGVQIFRVHDVAETKQAFDLFEAVEQGILMGRKYFGTDGVRGRANQHPMTAEMALKIGAAAGHYFRRFSDRTHRVVIGKDTRRSGYMLKTR